VKILDDKSYTEKIGYSGRNIAELDKFPMFIELISYDGSSIDSHKIFIYKNLTSITQRK